MTRQAFTLVEILIVVVVLGILAAVIVPQFGESGEAARYSATIENLQHLRSAVDLYRNQHQGLLPGVSGADPDLVFAAQLTRPTNARGERSSNPDEGFGDPQFPFGPYVPQLLPANPYNGSRRVKTVDKFPAVAPGGDGRFSAGWIFEITSGRIKINQEGVSADGLPFWEL